MEPELQICALEDCFNIVNKKVHNQRFCSPECCRIHTNKKILEQYHLKKNKDLKNRVCRQKNCNTVLSVYNEDDRCAVHQKKEYIKRLQGWGWEIEEDFKWEMG